MHRNFIEIDPLKLDVILDIRYNSNNNITGSNIYQNNNYNFLHKDAYNKLLSAINIAKKENFKFKIFDLYRPKSIQEELYELYKDTNPYLFSNPNKGSVPHVRGAAIDLTLCKLDNGQEIDMGTDFDDLTEKAYHDNKDITSHQIDNRKILLKIMTQAGWDFYDKEWWHYQLFNIYNFEIV